MIDTVRLHIAGAAYAPLTARIREITQGTGTEVGTAIVGWPQKYAAEQSAKYGDKAYITYGSEVIFRGIIVTDPMMIGNETDEVMLHLADDKWMLSRLIVGMNGVGTQGTPAGSLGFKDVGYDITFNRAGRPDKQADAFDFNLGTAAAEWTLQQMLEFIFAWYVDADVATLKSSVLGANYAASRSNVCVTGQSALQAIETIAELAGETWGLVPGRESSQFAPVRPGGYGRRRNVFLANPKSGATFSASDRYYADDIQPKSSIQNCRDSIQVVSGPGVQESVYSNSPTNGLLARKTGFVDVEYKARYEVDVTKYAAANLGQNLSAGAKPKAWLSHLCTRRNAASNWYLTAAEMAATPANQDAPRIEIPVWVSKTNEAAAQLVIDGIKIDLENRTLDLKDQLICNKAGSLTEKETLTITNWTTLLVWMTVATVTEVIDYKESPKASSFLPKQFWQVVRRPDLVTERRRNSWLPNLTTGGILKQVDTQPDGDTYLDASEKLQKVLDGVVRLSPKKETELAFGFPLMPVFNIGDLLNVSGRQIGQNGDEVVVSIRYSVHDDYLTSITATNLIAAARKQAVKLRKTERGANARMRTARARFDAIGSDRRELDDR